MLQLVLDLLHYSILYLDSKLRLSLRDCRAGAQLIYYNELELNLKVHNSIGLTYGSREHLQNVNHSQQLHDGHLRFEQTRISFT